MRRFALVVGNDEGGDDTRLAALRARRRAQAVRDPHAARRRAAAKTRCCCSTTSATTCSPRSASWSGGRGRAAGRAHRALLLLLGPREGRRAAAGRDSQLPLEALKARLAQSPADVRIAIFDACRSGALTAHQGRAPRARLRGRVATPRATAKGLVILTSSASDEDSQESDAIGGSYFSHHLASGPAGRRGPVGRRARVAARGLRLRLRAHRGRHRRERGRARSTRPSATTWRATATWC